MSIPVHAAAQIAALLQVVDIVSRLVARGRMYEKVFIGEVIIHQAPDGLERALVTVYKACLALLSDAHSLSFFFLSSFFPK